ncbi:hypothetical protein F5146DRAFT_1055067 [Armillaria mellea]|nr:hypothetical protein F5146DRAFT_1055067 [Armillaria mellea]
MTGVFGAVLHYVSILTCSVYFCMFNVDSVLCSLPVMVLLINFSYVGTWKSVQLDIL